MKIVVIGISTGGPSIIKKILKSLDSTINGALVICIHMQPQIIENFIKRMSTLTKIPIETTKDFLEIKKNRIYICTAQKDTIYKNIDNKEMFFLDNSSNSFYKPDINKFFNSIAKHKKDIENVMAIILTGIGEDGVKGMLLLKDKGAMTIASDEESSIVYGMPKKAKEVGACNKILTLEEIIRSIKSFLND